MTDLDAYTAFLEKKVDFHQTYGYDIEPGDIHPMLLPHQRAIVQWAVKGGRRAIFAAFGLGKSLMQIETVRLTLEHSGGNGRGLIICPLGVRQEFRRDAEMIGIETRFVRRDHEIDGPGIYVTNYESVRDGRLDPNQFDAVSLDEASVLRSFGSKTFIEFLSLMANVPHKFVATATPAPNRYKELIHYAGFLGVMDTGQALTRFFKRDSTSANKLTLYPHKEHEFFLWLASWSIFLQKPSDLGFSDDGYDLPPIEVVFHEVDSDALANLGFDNFGQGVLVRDGSLGVTGASKEKRATMAARIWKVAELVDEAPDDHFILWHTLEDERREIKKAIPEAVEIFGTLDIDERERRIIDFSDGRSRILATKPVLSGSGCNFQRFCHRAIFVGIDFKFNDFIQAVHRIQRFQQARPVRIDIVHSDTERTVVRTLMDKWERHKELTETMSEIIREHGLSHSDIGEALKRSLGVARVEASGDGWMHVNNDCVDEMGHIDDNEIDLIVTSIPFANHYEYTPSLNDFGHTDNNDHFWAQMDYLTPNLLRVLEPGRMYCCHVKDRILFGNQYGTGASTVSPFHAEAIAHTMKHGFDYMGMITVVTDVVRENNQTYRLGWTEQCKDSTKMGVGSPEYILLFRKPQTDRTKGYADVRVEHSKADYTKARWQIDAHAFWRSSGDRHLTTEELQELPSAALAEMFRQAQAEDVYSYESHLRIGEVLDGRGRLPSTFMLLDPESHHPDVWHDVNRMVTLNTSQSQRNQTMHICPLQFDIVDRLIERFSNPGELVFDPFGGLATVPVRALKAGRRGRAVELNADYWADGVKYCELEERKRSAPTLFDVLPVSA